MRSQFVPLEEALKVLRAARRILFYPSAGWFSGPARLANQVGKKLPKFWHEHQQLYAAFDCIVLNSYDYPRFQVWRHAGIKDTCWVEIDGPVIKFALDNNELLGHFKREGVTIHTLLVIRDGCSEGGNYECVTGDRFMGHVLPVVRDTFEFYYDHLSRWRGRTFDLPLARDAIEPIPEYLKPLIAASHPIKEVKGLRLARPKCPDTAQGRVGQTEVRVIRDSIWCHDHEEDLLFVHRGGSAETATSFYLKSLPELAGKVSFVRGTDDFTKALEQARQRGARWIGFTPFKADYRKVLNVLEKFPEPPQRVTFYHLNTGDFRAIYHRLGGRVSCTA